MQQATGTALREQQQPGVRWAEQRTRVFLGGRRGQLNVAAHNLVRGKKTLVKMRPDTILEITGKHRFGLPVQGIKGQAQLGQGDVQQLTARRLVQLVYADHFRYRQGERITQLINKLTRFLDESELRVLRQQGSHQSTGE